MKSSFFSATGFAALTLAATIPCAAQYGQSPNLPNGKAGLLKSEYVKTGLYVIAGPSGNTVLRLTGAGLVLVDGTSPDHYEELVKRVQKIADQPVRVLIDTDDSPQHCGANGLFLKAGTQIVAQQNVKRELTATDGASASLTPPSFTYDREETLHFGAVEVRLIHPAPARTDDATIVYFPDLKVVALGDLYAEDASSISPGPSLPGWSAALNQVLALDFDLAIPGRGPVLKRADVEAFKTRLESLSQPHSGH